MRINSRSDIQIGLVRVFVGFREAAITAAIENRGIEEEARQVGLDNIGDLSQGYGA